MGLLDWLGNLFSSGERQDAYRVHVRCAECGELLRTRVDLSHDLTAQYDSNDRTEGYFTRKALIGSGPCFNQVDVEIQFDAHRRPVDHQIQGGELISEEEYQAGISGEES